MKELDEKDVCNALVTLREMIEQVYGESRPRSVAITKLDECGLWLGLQLIAARTRAQGEEGAGTVPA